MLCYNDSYTTDKEIKVAHKLERFSKSVLQTPQLISAEKFTEIADFLSERNASLYNKTYEAALEANNSFSVDDKGSEDLVETNVGVLRVRGTLTDKATGWEALCGGTNYRQLVKDMDYLCSLPQVSTILMDIDSPGGEAFNCFATARLLREKARKAGKKLIGYVDGISASAAYALTSCCDEVVIHPDGQAGSIGVVIALRDDSEAKKKAGVKDIYITAGESKVPFKDDGSFKPEFLEKLQKRVTELYDGFIDHVATMRNIEPKLVKDTEAEMFSAKDALDLGLVDKIMEPEEFYTYLADYGEPKIVDMLKMENSDSDEYNLKSQEDKLNMAQPEITPEMFAEMKTQLDKQKSQLKAYQEKELLAKKEKVSEKLEADAPFLSNKENLVEFLMSADKSQADLVNGIIADCALKVKSVQEEMSAKVTEAKDKAQEALQSAEKVKEEFGTAEHTPDTELAVMSGTSDILAEKIARKKAQMLNK